MHLREFLRLATSFAALGQSVGTQFSDVVDGEPFGEQNPNALRQCLPLLTRLDAAGVAGAADMKHDIEMHLSAVAR